MEIKVLGTGCANCHTTAKLIEEVAAKKGVKIQLSQVEDIQAIMSYGVMSTPGVVVDNTLVHSGSVPSREKVAGWLLGAVAAPAPVAASGSGCCGGCC